MLVDKVCSEDGMRAAQEEQDDTKEERHPHCRPLMETHSRAEGRRKRTTPTKT